MIGAVPQQRETRRASRYEAIIATLVGLCALCVSAYTAYVQRQQVRAAVWPILEFDSSNARDIHFTLANKGAETGDYPACHCNGRWPAVRNWTEALEKNTGTWGASVFGERHEFSCVGRGRIEGRLHSARS
jgi:hypothetical protein